MKETLQKAYDILNLIYNGIDYKGVTVDNLQTFVIKIPKEAAAHIAPEGLVNAIENIRDEFGIELQQPTKIAPPDEKFDPAARLYQQMLALDPAKAASVSKIKTNGSSTEVTFVTNPILGSVNRINYFTDSASMEVTPVERTADCKGDGTVSTT